MQSPIVSAILREYEERKRKNPQYSLRAFAVHLKVNVSTLSRLIRGQRKASAELVKSIADRLHLSPSMREQLLLAELGIGEDPQAFMKKLIPMTAAQEKAMAGWEYLTTQALIETDLIITTAAQVAKLLGIPATQAKTCLKTLEEQKMIEFHDGRYKSTYKKMISNRKDNPDVVKILAEFMDMAKKNLMERDSEQQSYSGMVMPVDPLRIPEANARIRQFRNELATFLGTGRKTEVYRLSLQLFPVTETGFFRGRKSDSVEE